MIALLRHCYEGLMGDLGHWGHDFEENCGTLVPFSLSSAPYIMM